MIAIIDYGMGNIHSVNKALQIYQVKTIVTNKAVDLEDCHKIVLPGVGAFRDAMSELKKQDLITPLKEQLKNKKPFLGICLGMQLLFENSQEADGIDGLGILKGRVERFPERIGLKVPHMGWNQLKIVKNDCPLVKDMPEQGCVYFCHSYYPFPKNRDVTAALTDYGRDFSSIIWQDNIYGVQFHPEKSQSVGLKILENFINLC